METSEKIERYKRKLKFEIQALLIGKKYEHLHEIMSAAAEAETLLNLNKPRQQHGQQGWKKPPQYHGNKNNFNSKVTAAVGRVSNNSGNNGENLQPGSDDENDAEGGDVQLNAGNIKIGKLTPEAREDCRRRGACFRCRRTGHMSSACTTFPSTSYTPASQQSKK